MRRKRTFAIITTLLVAAFELASAHPAGASGGTQTFSYTGAAQLFTVPSGITSIAVISYGASGGSGGHGAGGGGGARGHAPSISVTPGSILQVNVGGAGGSGASGGSPGGGGFNGGGVGGTGGPGGGGGGGGGGASDVRVSPYGSGDRLIVAGGAGGGGGDDNINAGPGGSGGDIGTDGGNAAAGGGQSGGNGALGGGGNGGGGSGGNGSATSGGGGGGAAFDAGGGGGGGATGGGGGGGNSNGGTYGGGGGGGGSSAGGSDYQTGVRAGDGDVTIIFGDSSAPAVTLVGPANGSTTNSTNPAFSGNAGTAVGDGDVTVNVYAGGTTSGTFVGSFSETPAADGAYSGAIGALSDGQYTAQATQTDASGNTGTSSANTFTVDTTAPTPTLDAPADASVTNDPTPTFSGTAGIATGDSTTLVTVEVYSGATISGSPVVTFTADPDDITGVYTIDPTVILPDGEYTARARQSDDVGNTGYSASTTFTVDTTGPTTTFDSTPKAKTKKRATTFTFHASETPATFMCQLDAHAAYSCSSPQTFSVKPGRHLFAVTATDGAGNAGPPTGYKWKVTRP